MDYSRYHGQYHELHSIVFRYNWIVIPYLTSSSIIPVSLLLLLRLGTSKKSKNTSWWLLEWVKTCKDGLLGILGDTRNWDLMALFYRDNSMNQAIFHVSCWFMISWGGDTTRYIFGMILIQCEGILINFNQCHPIPLILTQICFFLYNPVLFTVPCFLGCVWYSRDYT